MESQVRRVEYYRQHDGFSPFEKWLLSLAIPVRATMLRRIDRLERGVLGDYKALADGIIEVREHSGPGYRIYAGIYGHSIIVLTGSVKTDQKRTIPVAKALWNEFKQRMT